MHYFFKVVLFSVLLLCSLSTWGAGNNKPFARGALTVGQLDAWTNYITEESNLLGCHYGDDPRLTEDPEGTLLKLYQGENIEPVKVTYRTLLNIGPQTRALISKNIVVSNMECEDIYYDGSALIGVPIIPFEEALTILHDDYAMYGDEERVQSLRNTFIVASMDPRWFWAYFIADKAHMDLIGLDFETLVIVDKIVNKRDALSTYEDDSYNLPYNILKGLHHRPLAYFSETGECAESKSEPDGSMIVWPEITDDIIKGFYLANQVGFKGQWKTKVKKEDEGFSLYQEKPINDNAFPAFKVSRGLSVRSHYCK
jgi:hypothetical protein